jgi:F-type H+-transporting ATPase subunit gamma
VVTSDRGLCGAFNQNVLKRAELAAREWLEFYREVTVSVVGRKGKEYLQRRRPLAASWTGLGAVEYRHAEAIAQHLSQRYLAGEIDGAALVYNEFVSAISQRPNVDPLLPLSADEEMAEAGEAAPYDTEPEPIALLDVLVPNAVAFTVYRALLETQAGFYAAQMTAMESATRNTEELIRSLTLQFNRARQAAITKELVEIVSGAEALK